MESQLLRLFRSLKSIHFLPPVFAALGVAAFVLPQRKAIETTKEELARLREGRQESTSHPSKPVDRTAKSTPVSPAKSPRSYAELTSRMEALGVDQLFELVEPLMEECKDDESKQTKDAALWRLAKVAPDKLLVHFADRVGEKDFSDHNVLQAALKAWAGQDPRSAVAWVDERIKKGTFDDTSAVKSNPVWLAYETALASGAMVADLPAVSARLATMEAEERQAILMWGASVNLGQMSGNEEQAAYGKLCHQHLSEDGVRTVLEWMAEPAGQKGGWSEITALFDRFGATPEERVDLVRKVASGPVVRKAAKEKVTTADLDKMRAWAKSEGCRSIEALTGTALRHVAYAEETGLDAAIEMLVAYHDRSGSDAMLANFLEGQGSRINEVRCQQLVDRIKNPATKAKVMAGIERDKSNR